MIKFIKDLLFKIRNYDKLSQASEQLLDLVWDNAAFYDNDGRIGSDRDSEQVTKKWDTYHKISREITKLTNY